MPVEKSGEKNGQPIIAFRTTEEFAAWLDAEHDRAPGVWIKLAKKGTGVETIGYRPAVRVALCYGWIDGQSSTLDERFWLQRFTRRTARSRWSKINRTLAEQLIADGLMHPAGVRAVEAARADGRWDAAYDSPSTATVPGDLQAALDANPAAAEFFATLNSTNRYAILHRIQDAKRPETRARRIEKYVGMLNRQEKVYP